MEGFQTLKGSWPWPWPSIRPYGIPSCITRRPLPIYQLSFKLKKLFVDGRTYGRTDGRTDGQTFFPSNIIRSTFRSRPNNKKGSCDQKDAPLIVNFLCELLLVSVYKRIKFEACTLYRFRNICRWKCRDLEMWDKGHSRSLEMAPIDRSRTSSYSGVYDPVLYHFPDRARYWSKIAIFSIPYAHARRSLSEYRHKIWYGITEMLKWCGYPTVKNVWEYVYSFRHNTQTWKTSDGKTDRRTNTAHSTGRAVE